MEGNQEDIPEGLAQADMAETEEILETTEVAEEKDTRIVAEETATVDAVDGKCKT